MIGASPKCFEKRSGSIVAEVMMTLRSGRLRQQPLEIPEQEIDVEDALVRLVDDDRVVGLEQAIALRLGEQYAVGHELDVGLRGRLCPGSAPCIRRLAERVFELLGDARGHGAGGDAARLRVADDAGDAAPELEAYLRQLRGLARAGLAAEDDDRVFSMARRSPRGAARSAALRDKEIAGTLAARAARAAVDAAIFAPNAFRPRPRRCRAVVRHAGDRFRAAGDAGRGAGRCRWTLRWRMPASSWAETSGRDAAGGWRKSTGSASPQQRSTKNPYTRVGQSRLVPTRQAAYIKCPVKEDV